jgi:surface-anchored protein
MFLRYSVRVVIPGVLGLAAIFMTLSQPLQAEFSYSAGHGDVGVAYAGGNALELHWHLDDGAVVDGVAMSEAEYEPDELKAIVPTSSNFVRVASPAWDFIGNSAGATTYYLPETDTPGAPFLGFGSEELIGAGFTGPTLNWSVSLDAAPAGGHFSLFNDLGTPAVAASTFANDLAFETILGGHSHFNMAFTQPGVYDLTFTVGGNHSVAGLATDTQTFRFDVSPVPEPSSIGGALALAGGWAFRRRRKRAKS